MDQADAVALTPREERFCQAIAAGATAAAAALRAGCAIDTAPRRGRDLLTKPYIRLRIEGLLAEQDAARRAARDDLVRSIDELYRPARRRGDLRAALRCLRTKARLLGLWSGHGGGRRPPRCRRRIRRSTRRRRERPG